MSKSFKKNENRKWEGKRTDYSDRNSSKVIRRDKIAASMRVREKESAFTDWN